jgi:hypothetical protein
MFPPLVPSFTGQFWATLGLGSAASTDGIKARRLTAQTLQDFRNTGTLISGRDSTLAGAKKGVLQGYTIGGPSAKSTLSLLKSPPRGLPQYLTPAVHLEHCSSRLVYRSESDNGEGCGPHPRANWQVHYNVLLFLLAFIFVMIMPH